MTNTIFDLVEPDFDSIPEGKKGFFDLASQGPEAKDDGFISEMTNFAKKFHERSSNLGKSLLKGTLEGVEQAGKIISPGTGYKSGEDEGKSLSEQLDESIPTEEDFLSSSLRRGAKMVPSTLIFPGGALNTLPRAIAAGFTGQAAEDLGAPEWAQTAAELTAFIGPDVTKKLIEKGSNKEIIAAGKKLGMTDEQLTPLLQSDFKKKWLSKFIPRRGGIQRSLSDSKKGVQNAYSNLISSEDAGMKLAPTATKDLLNQFDKLLFDMPAGVRELVTKDLKDLKSKPITGKTLMNFYADVGHYLGEDTKQLSLLKKPIKDALSNISPQLGKDFELVNTLYSKYYDIAGKLKPNMKTDVMEAILSSSEAIGGLIGVITGNYPVIVSMSSEKAAKVLAKQMITNPRFQQLSNKIVEAINNNKPAVVMKLIDLLGMEVRKTSPEMADKLESLTGKEITDFLNQTKEQ